MSTPEEQKISQLPGAMPLSRILRVALGLFMMALIAPALVSANWPDRARVAAVFVAMVALYTAIHWLVARYSGWLHPCVGAAIAVVPALAVFLQGGVYEVGAIAFIGLSLIVIAAAGDPGCEVLAFPALILGRRTHLACLLFSPLDWIEEKFVAWFRRAPS